MNYKRKNCTTPANALAAETACKLDSKARLVLPWKIRELLSVSYGDCVSIKIVGKNNGGLVLKVSPASNPSAGGMPGRFVKTSKNGWEKIASIK